VLHGRRKTAGTLIVALCVAVTFLLTAGLADAKGGKKPKPPPDPGDPGDSGVVYFKNAQTLYEMDQDGSNKTALPGVKLEWGWEYGPPSRELHGNERWFLQFKAVEGEEYPNGQARWYPYAISESGTAVQLSDDPNLEPATKPGGGSPVWQGRPRWATEDGTKDGKVSFLARKWVEDSDTGQWSVAEYGIFVASLDPSDLLTAEGSLDLQWARVPVDFSARYASQDTEETNPIVDVQYDWSPGGSAIAYVDLVGDDPGIWLAEEASTSWTKTRLTTSGEYPRWSNDGDRIAFESSSGIHTMDSDGTDETVIVTDPADSRNIRKYVQGARWSPNDTHLIYLYGEWDNKRFYARRSDIYRINADGSSKTLLTGDTDRLVGIVDWCSD